MENRINAILHYLGDWIDDNTGKYVEDCAEDLIRMVKQIGEVKTMEGKAVKEIQAKMKTWTDAGIELAYNSGYEQGKADAIDLYKECEEELEETEVRIPFVRIMGRLYCRYADVQDLINQMKRERSR